MGEDKQEICFHIMHSMKGGCGKSTCALFKALQLATENMEKQEKVLFLDADFKGSALQPLLFRNDDAGYAKGEICSQVLEKMGNPPVKGDGSRHTIAIPENYREENNLSHFLRVLDFPFSTLVQKSFSYSNKAEDPVAPPEYVMNGYIDFVLTAAKSEDKDWFRYRKHDGKIAPGIFVNRMAKLMDYVLLHNATVAEDDDRTNKPLGQYGHVVVDMPPGYDEYSDMLLEVLRRLATNDKRVKLHYYHVTTDDIGHMALAVENTEKMCTLETEFREFSTVNAILNNPFSVKTVPGSDEDWEYLTRIQADVARLKGLLGKKGKIYYNGYNDSFHTYSTITDKLEFRLDGSVLAEL